MRPEARGIEGEPEAPAASGAHAASTALRVFVSCTHDDLAAHAKIVVGQVVRLDSVPVHQEFWGATGRPSVKECLERVRTCNVLVVLLAHRYGWIPSEAEGGDDRRSITWLEVDEARRSCIPVLPFFVDPESLWRTKFVDDRSSREGMLLAELKTELARGLRGQFNESAESIAQPAYQSLSETSQRLRTSRVSGVVPADAVRPALTTPGLARHLLDQWFPRLHTWLTTKGALSKPPEFGELREYLGEQRSALESAGRSGDCR